MATTRTREPRPPGPPSGRPPTGGSGGRVRRKKRKAWVVRLQLILALFFVFVLSVIVLGVVFIAHQIQQLPSSATDIENFQPLGRSLVYSSDGTLLASLFVENRQTVTIDHIAKNLQQATVDIEDSRFYQNNYGVDFRGISRALFKNVQGGDLTGQGGSTITQQLVRNLGIDGIGHEKSLKRKILEAVFAFKIDQNYSKQQILEMYLNQVYYGSGAYGVQAAAETYFGKTANNLDLAQCAMIAGLVQRPSRLSPYVDKDAAMARRNIVLARMLQLGHISPAECSAAEAEPIVLAFPKPPSSGSKTYHAAYFVDYVVRQLTDRYGSDMVYRGGLRIVTTLNWQMQAAAEQAVQQGVGGGSYFGATDAALIAMEPQTGYIKAMVGGLDYTKSQFNIAADGHRQPGSSFKPVIYTAAIDSGLITENTMILDAPISLPGATGPWTPTNDDHRFHGWVTARNAVANSINVPAVKVLREVGVDTVIHYATMMGIKSPLQPYLTLALGASAVTPLEMATMYSVIANQGERPTPTAIERVEQSDGTVLEDDVPQLETTSIRVDALKQMDDMLRAVVTSGTASLVFADGNPPEVRGKTGTTQSHIDAWFDGYVPKMTCVVWAGHPSVDPKSGKPIFIPMRGDAWGATICAPIWKKFMIAALAIEAKQAAKDAPKPPTPSTTAVTAGKPTAIVRTTPATTTATPTKQTVSSGAAVVPANSDPGATVSSDGKTVSVWVDNTTALRATPGAPGAHQETFITGTQPTTFVDGSHVGDNSSEAGTAPTPSAPSNQQAPQNSDGDNNGDDQSTPSSHQHASVPTSLGQKMVTVTICVESGMRATEWCPETIDKQFPTNKVPGYCTLHKPPPGE
jgi:penicillin-binding protein 1A